MDQMTDLQMWSMLTGALLPPAVAVVNRPDWTAAARFGMTVAMCVLTAAMTVYLTGRFSGRSWLSSALIVGVTALVTYRTGWRPSGITDAIEQSTSPDRT